MVILLNKILGLFMHIKAEMTEKSKKMLFMVTNYIDKDNVYLIVIVTVIVKK